MVPAFIANSTGSNGVGLTFTATIPAGTAIGDILYTAIAYRNTSTWSTNNALGVWTGVHASATGNSNTQATNGRGSLYSFYHVYNGTSPNLTFTVTANANVWRQTTVAIRGINPVTPLGNVSLTVAASAATVANTPGITAGPSGFLVMCIGSGCDQTFSAANAATEPLAGEWTERTDVLSTSGGDTTLMVATATKNTAGGLTGTFNCTGTNTTFNCIGVAEFKPYVRARQRYICGA